MKKAAATPKSCRSRFSATKNHRIRTCRFSCLPHLSSSPDLRLLSVPAAFSAFANDRLSSLQGHLHAYSGGTVRDLHPIRYSPTAAMTTAAGTQREYSLVYIRIAPKSFFVNRRSRKIRIARCLAARSPATRWARQPPWGRDPAAAAWRGQRRLSPCRNTL